MTDEKCCQSCGRKIKGRADKKFCDDYCRNNFNNRQKALSSHSSYVRNINNTLLKNRKILEAALPVHEENIKISRDKLQWLGFSFKYFTHTYTNKAGKIYFFCYDYGYLPLHEEYYLVVKRKET